MSFVRFILIGLAMAAFAFSLFIVMMVWGYFEAMSSGISTSARNKVNRLVGALCFADRSPRPSLPILPALNPSSISAGQKNFIMLRFPA